MLWLGLAIGSGLVILVATNKESDDLAIACAQVEQDAKWDADRGLCVVSRMAGEK